MPLEFLVLAAGIDANRPPAGAFESHAGYPLFQSASGASPAHAAVNPGLNHGVFTAKRTPSQTLPRSSYNSAVEYGRTWQPGASRFDWSRFAGSSPVQVIHVGAVELEYDDRADTVLYNLYQPDLPLGEWRLGLGAADADGPGLSFGANLNWRFGLKGH